MDILQLSELYFEHMTVPVGAVGAAEFACFARRLTQGGDAVLMTEEQLLFCRNHNISMDGSLIIDGFNSQNSWTNN